MIDKVSKYERSRIMSLVKSKGNVTTELKMVSLLKKNGITGWKCHVKMMGTPDFVWANIKVALFVDGCFWHGCNKCNKRPLSNKHYWDDKIKKNIKHDRKVNRILRREGWMVIRVKECMLDKKFTETRIINLIFNRNRLFDS